MKSIKLKSRPIEGFSAVCVGKDGWLVETPLGNRGVVTWREFVNNYVPHGKIAKAVIEQAADSLGINIAAFLEKPGLTHPLPLEGAAPTERDTHNCAAPIAKPSVAPATQSR